MRWIDFDNKKPTDQFDGWTPWTQQEWDEWLAESQRLTQELARLTTAGDREARNKLMDDNSDHWGQLKPWLSAISYGKCWFTEARDIASHMDVEHFRPKKEAKNLDKVVRDGYWWLAFDYANYRLAGNVLNRKKGGWFPLRSNSQISTVTNRCEASEYRYLLDPVDQGDTALVAFDEEGKAIPVPGCNDWEKERVKESIDRFKLNDHPALPDERKRVWQRMVKAIRDFQDARAHNATVNDPAALGQMKSVLEAMRSMVAPDAELSSVAKWCIRFSGENVLLSIAG